MSSAPLVFSAEEALAMGLTRDQIRQRVRSGRWTRVGRGYYSTTEALYRPDLDHHQSDREHHLARAIAAAKRNAGCVIAFESAAVRHGMALWDPLPAAVTLIVPPGAWTGRRTHTVFRASSTPTHQVSSGVAPCTSAPRTWTDLARTGSLAQALSTGDHGLRTGLFTIGELAVAVEESGRSRGFRRAERALGLLDARRESPLESASYAYFADHRIPLPVPQHEFYDGVGRLVARVDCWWESGRLVGECDGRMKYRTADDLYQEKLREDRLRAMDLGVMRWGARDLRTETLAQLLRARLHR